MTGPTFAQARVRATQPQGPVQINWGNPLTRALDLVFMPTVRNFNPANRNKPLDVKSGALFQVGLQPGVSHVTLNSNTTIPQHIESLDPIAGATDFTLLMGVVFRDFNATTFSNAATNDGAALYSQRRLDADVSPTLTVSSSGFAGSGGTFHLFWGTDTSGVANGVNSSTVMALDTPYVIGARAYASTGSGDYQGLSLYVGGKNVSVSPTSTAGSFNNSWGGDTAYIGGHAQWPAGSQDNASKETLFFFRWRRALTDAEIARVTDNPWQLFKPQAPVYVDSTLPPQLLVPTTDISAGNWSPSTGTSLFSTINEQPTANDTNYDQAVTTGSPMIVKLSAGIDPGVPRDGFKVKYRIKGDAGMIVKLLQGSTVIASWTHTSVPTDWTTFSQPLTSTQADNITDYTDLRMKFDVVMATLTDAPTSLTIGTPTPTTQPLSATAPAGGATVVSYGLDYKLSSASLWTNWSTTLPGPNATVTGLTVGTAYDYRMYGVNNAGNGPSVSGSGTTQVGTLTMETFVPDPAGTNATDEGSLDWIVMSGFVTGDLGMNGRKSNGAGSYVGLIGLPSFLGGGGGSNFTRTMPSLNWTDGMSADGSGVVPYGYCIASTNRANGPGFYLTSSGDGLRTVVTVDATTKKIRLYWGIANFAGTSLRVSTSLSNAAAPDQYIDFTNSVETPLGVEITVMAGAAATLNIDIAYNSAATGGFMQGMTMFTGFSENFSGVSGTVLDTYNPAWTTRAGYLSLGQAYFDAPNMACQGTGATGPHLATRGGFADNFKMSALIMANYTGESIVFRYVDLNNFSAVGLSGSGTKIRLIEVTAGVATYQDFDATYDWPMGLSQSYQHKLSFTVSNQTVVASIDGTPMANTLTATRPTTSAVVGIRTENNNSGGAINAVICQAT